MIGDSSYCMKRKRIGIEQCFGDHFLDQRIELE